MKPGVSKRRVLTGVLVASALAGIAVGIPVVASATAGPVGHVVKPASTASISQTLCWGGVNDGAILTWNGAPVSGGQAVAVSAAEANQPTGAGEFIGDANVYSEEVAVVTDAIQVRVHTGWGAPLNVCLHFVG